MKNISLTCTENGSNKEYHVQMVKSKDLFLVNFQYGAIGRALTAGTKTKEAVTEAQAEKIFNSLVKEKLAKGYVESGESKVEFSGPALAKKETHGIFPQLLNTVEDSEVQKFINDDNYLGQEKFDGERRMVKSEGDFGDVLMGLNKKGQEVQLPDIIRNAIKYFRCVVDGEIVGEKLYVFDLLSLRGTTLKMESCVERLKKLGTLNFGVAIEIVKTAYTKAEKQKLYDELKARNAEGIVFKRKDSMYVAGRPHSGGSQLKNKFIKEASFIVENITKGKRSVGLTLLNEKGEKIPVGKCTIPPNKSIPEVGEIVEVKYLYAYRDGCIFQPVYKDKRNDVDLEECTVDQLIYKAEV